MDYELDICRELYKDSAKSFTGDFGIDSNFICIVITIGGDYCNRRLLLNSCTQTNICCLCIIFQRDTVNPATIPFIFRYSYIYQAVTKYTSNNDMRDRINFKFSRIYERSGSRITSFCT